ncbi:MAG: hypothetical protein QOF95_3261, partial [Pseudonocardiales bacterium]|nr:hypothetical protein [Pseudonocardiales bacterium]
GAPGRARLDRDGLTVDHPYRPRRAALTRASRGSVVVALSTGAARRPDGCAAGYRRGVSGMGEWDATTYEGKDTILRVVRREADELFALVEPAEVWDRKTACAKWSTRDVVGHLVDTIEGYFAAFDAVHSGTEPAKPHGLPAMSQVAGDQAIAFRDASQAEMLERLHTDFDKVMELLDSVGPDDWAGLIVTHPYMGPVPAFFYAAGQLMDFAVHSWDIREGSGQAHTMSADAADLLIPFMFVLWQASIRADADTSPFQLGIRVTTGHNAGDFRVSISPDGMTYEPGSVDDLPSVLEFDAASLVLVAFGRCDAGTMRGDRAIAERFLNLFFRV